MALPGRLFFVSGAAMSTILSRLIGGYLLPVSGLVSSFVILLGAL